MRALIGLCAAATVLTAIAIAAHADVILSDGTFLDADWVQENSGSGSCVGVQVPGGGNPGPFREVTTVTGPLAGDTTWSLHRFGQTMTTRYDPVTQGPILSLDFSLDYRGSGGVATGQRVYAALKQNQTIYAATSLEVIAGDGLWHTLDLQNLSAVSFVALNAGPVTPNFSATGMPIRFGYITSNTTGAAGSYTSIADYDNFRVRIVPAPGLAGALAAAGFVGARRRR